ncbi:hypothetical protein [Puia sp.]|jgi:hypothetical protein|uniref:hypothetical protein n=1 Tax=Puia sp. TaxID=2045100 RepID=UPI002F420BC7
MDVASRFTAQVLTRCELYTIDKKDYLRLHLLVDKWPALERALITRCLSRLRKKKQTI